MQFAAYGLRTRKSVIPFQQVLAYVKPTVIVNQDLKNIKRSSYVNAIFWVYISLATWMIKPRLRLAY
jgi:hypothetical protein